MYIKFKKNIQGQPGKHDSSQRHKSTEYENVLEPQAKQLYRYKNVQSCEQELQDLQRHNYAFSLSPGKNINPHLQMSIHYTHEYKTL